uniref:hypothetical protein n=1 Tax=Haematobacter sp. TaxID=2953762 RepID=UPI0039181C35
MPARLRRIAAHTFRDQTQTRCFPRLRRELQPPPLTQVERPGDLNHHHGYDPILQRLLCDGQGFHLIVTTGQQKAPRINKRPQTADSNEVGQGFRTSAGQS